VSTISLYRKYRSQTFGDLIGQEHVVRTLQNGVASGRISHAYLFTGPRGTGKTSTARLLAKSLCCENGPLANPSPDDPIVQMITAGSCPDVMEMDAASDSSVDSIREKIIEVAEYRPMMARYKVIIIDEVHDLSGKAFDALLKTIEEPPEHLIFILATTEYNKVPPTIRSRCQKFEFHRASMADLCARITYVAEAEEVQIDPPAVSAIARMADGGYRDALTLLEQAILTADGHITLQKVYDQLGLVAEETIDSLLLGAVSSDVVHVLSVLDEIARLGRDPRAILESALYRLADLTRASYEVQDATDASRNAAMFDMAAKLGRTNILRLRGAVSDAHRVIRDVSLPKIWLESEFVKLTSNLSRAEERPQPAPAAAAPVAAKPVATPDPTRAEPARPESAHQEPARPAAAQIEPVQSEPIQEEAVSAVDPWSKVLAQLPEGVAVLRKSVGSQFVSQQGNEISVRVAKQMDYEWWMDDARRLSYINGFAAKALGAGTVIKFLPPDKPAITTASDSPAVDLGKGGDKLDQMVREELKDRIYRPEP